MGVQILCLDFNQISTLKKLNRFNYHYGVYLLLFESYQMVLIGIKLLLETLLRFKSSMNRFILHKKLSWIDSLFMNIMSIFLSTQPPHFRLLNRFTLSLTRFTHQFYVIYLGKLTSISLDYIELYPFIPALHRINLKKHSKVSNLSLSINFFRLNTFSKNFWRIWDLDC